MIGYELAVACLALNVYHEAPFEPLYGQYAVALVTINRAKQRHLDMCDTVFQDKQFSWANNARDVHGKLLPQFLPNKGERWQHSLQVARITISGDQQDFTGGATHYYADYIVAPTWAKSLQLVGKWGHHYFYR